MSDETKGASNEERLLAAARADNVELLLEVFQGGLPYDINCQDGLGNTPLHNAVINGSTDVLEHILTDKDCDVDPVNKIARATPLHIAVQLEPEVLRNYVVESLLEAGADVTLKDKNGDIALDLVSPGNTTLRELFRKYQVKASISQDDIADSDDDDGEPGSGSDSE